jgi:hypothetical protein
MKKTNTKKEPVRAPSKVDSPLQACIRVEKLFRETSEYHIIMDDPNVGLGDWLKRVIRSGKKTKLSGQRA